MTSRTVMYLATLGSVIALTSSAFADVHLIGYDVSFAENYRKAVVEPFIKKTGINVVYHEIRLSAANLGQLRAEKGNPTMDLSIMDAMVARTGNAEGIFDKVDLSELPNAQNLYDQALVNEGYGPAITFDNTVLLYAKDMASPPSALSDLIRPELKGKVGMWAAPEIAALMNTILLTRAAGGDEKQSIELGIQKMAEIAPNVQTWAPSPDIYSLIINGTISVGTGWNARAQFYSDQSGGKITAAIPAEGAMLQINTINLVQGAPNREEALKFMDYALSPEAQSAFANLMYYSPTNKEATPSKEAIARTASSEETRAKLKPLDWTFFVANREAWLQEWRRSVISQ